MGLRDLTLYDFLTHNASVRSQAPAAISAERVVSNIEFLERVDQLAAGLTQRGLEHGDRLCILAQNSVEYLELYGACAKTGVIATPINWRLTAEEVGSVVELAEPKGLIVGAEHLALVEALDLASIELSDIDLRLAVGMDRPPPDFLPLAELYADPAPSLAEVTADDPFVIVATAAVEGLPRGAVLTHANLIHASYQIVAATGLTPSDRHLAALPLFHITGLGLSLAVTLAGGANVVTPAFDPALSARMIDEHSVTLMADFPPVLQMLLEARGQATWESLRIVLGLDSPDVIQRLQSETGAKFWTGFGQSETSGVVTLGTVDERPGSAGRPLPLARIRLVDERDEEVGFGEPGEITVQGPLVFQGYWRDPDATAYALRNGWHHTGDLGRFDEGGYLIYAGRLPEKELIKTGGENVYPEEVERVLRELPQVSQVCVIGVPDEKYGETVKAVVELEEGAQLSAEGVSQAVADRIASYKKPRQVEFVDSLPATPEGGIDRQQVRADYG